MASRWLTLIADGVFCPEINEWRRTRLSHGKFVQKWYRLNAVHVANVIQNSTENDDAYGIHGTSCSCTYTNKLAVIWITDPAQMGHRKADNYYDINSVANADTVCSSFAITWETQSSAERRLLCMCAWPGCVRHKQKQQWNKQIWRVSTLSA